MFLPKKDMNWTRWKRQTERQTDRQGDFYIPQNHLFRVTISWWDVRFVFKQKKYDFKKCYNEWASKISANSG